MSVANSSNHPQRSSRQYGWDYYCYASLVWAWAPAENKPPEDSRLEQNTQTEPWLSWDLDGEMIDSEERRAESAIGSEDSKPTGEGC